MCTLYVYMCICLYVYMCICVMCIYIYIYTRVCIYIYVYIYISLFRYAICAYAYIYIPIIYCIYIYIVGHPGGAQNQKCAFHSHYCSGMGKQPRTCMQVCQGQIIKCRRECRGMQFGSECAQNDGSARAWETLTKELVNSILESLSCSKSVDYIFTQSLPNHASSLYH